MILCVDSDAAARDATRDALDAAGFATAGADSVKAGREWLRDAPDPDGLITEYDLPDGLGLELVQAARETAPDAVCVVFTDTSVDDIETDGFADLVVEYVSKNGPNPRESLVSSVEDALATRLQTAYPLPEDEDARLAALERYATSPENLRASLDRLTEFATELLDADAAAVGLVDAREERFLSCHGVSFDPLDRQETVCTYAILDDDVTVIEDVRDDPRFSENAGLREAGIRFYASAPLVTPDGHAIGTVCVYDDEPRTLSERDRDLLRLLADEAMEQLELRRQLRTAGERDE